MDEQYYSSLLNFAHRGASARAPENTLAAFELAAELGADGIEFDVQLSRDREAVVCHDFVVDHTTNHRGRVRDFTVGELKRMDAGSWFSPRFAGQTIPTLQEVIDRVGGRLLLNVELKTGSLRGEGLEERVAQIIRANDLYSRVLVASFNPFALRRLSRIDGRVDLALLHAPDQPLHLRRAWLRRLAPCQALHPQYRMADARYVGWARRRGYRVNVWTVDEPAEMRRLIALGVNGIITIRPDALAEICAGHS